MLQGRQVFFVLAGLGFSASISLAISKLNKGSLGEDTKLLVIDKAWDQVLYEITGTSQRASYLYNV